MNRNSIIEIAFAYPIDEIIRRYAKDHDLPVSAAEEHAAEAKKFLVLCALNADKSYAVRGPIDDFWHTFITFTPRYMDFCERIAGSYIHHNPSTEERSYDKYSINRGLRGSAKTEVKFDGMRASYLAMLEDYESIFGSPAPLHLWPRPTKSESDSGLLGCFPCRCGCRCIA